MDLSVIPVFKRVIVSAVVVIVMSFHVTPVQAHAQLVKTEPARRAVLDKAPTEVRLWFSEEIEGFYTTLSVLDADKTPVTEAKPHVVSDDPKLIVLPLPELPDGKYSVKFRVLSVDGHIVESSFNYTVRNKNKAQDK